MKTMSRGCRHCELVRIGEGCRPDSRQARVASHVGTTHHEAVEWFKGLGYAVEPGPGLDEVTLINDRRPDFVAHHVVAAAKLAGMADLSQTITSQQIFRSETMDVPNLL